MFDKKVYVKLPNDTIGTIVGYNPLLGPIVGINSMCRTTELNLLDVTFTPVNTTDNVIDYSAIEYILSKNVVTNVNNAPTRFTKKLKLSRDVTLNTLVFILNRINTSVITSLPVDIVNGYTIIRNTENSIFIEVVSLLQVLLSKDDGFKLKAITKLSEKGFALIEIKYKNSCITHMGIQTSKGVIVYD